MHLPKAEKSEDENISLLLLTHAQYTHTHRKSIKRDSIKLFVDAFLDL